MRVFKKLLPSANLYLVILKQHAILIDTGDPHSKTKVLNFLRWNLSDRNLEYILITHSHWDHIGNVRFLKNIFSPKVLLGKKEARWVRKGYIDVPRPKGTLYSLVLYNFLSFLSRFETIERFRPDIEILEYKSINIENKSIEIFPTPGHTPGSLTFKIEKYAFTGDTLLGPNPFIRRPRLSMFLHKREEIFKSIDFLKTLDVEIYFPGHGLPFAKKELYNFGKCPL